MEMKRDIANQIIQEKTFLLDHPEMFFKLFDGLFPFFLFTRDPEGPLTSVSNKVTHVLGHAPEDFMQRWPDYLANHPVNETFKQRACLEAGFAKEPINYKTIFSNKQHEPIWLEMFESPQMADGKPDKIIGIALDLTKRSVLENQLRLGEKRFREMSQTSPIGIFQTDNDNLIAYVNPAWEVITGRTISESLGQVWWDCIHPGDQEDVIRKWGRGNDKGEEVDAECRVIRRNGTMIWVKIRSQILFDDTGKITIATVENIDQQVADREKQKQLIHELLQLKEKLEVATRTDPLTGLPNRRDLNDKLAHEKARFERTKRPFTLLIVDIDKFKSINDQYGHDAGDYILVQVGELLRNSCRRMDHICRWGGEEFFFLLPETNLENGYVFAEKLRAKLASTKFNYKGQQVSVTASFGLSCVNDDSRDLESYIKEADDCLYDAKNAGRNRTVARKRTGSN